MSHDEHEMLELLKFELKFVEDGGYGRSPRTPWRPPYILEDSPSCPNLSSWKRQALDRVVGVYSPLKTLHASRPVTTTCCMPFTARMY
jgi:hypothetical protein